MEKVLITGASGLVGTELSNLLSQNGYEVLHLSRTKNNSKFKTFLWDIEKYSIDDNALTDIKHIIHLAGAGIADKRWTKKRKKEIIDSRVRSTELLYDVVSKMKEKPATFISASAIGYYGAITSEKIFSETDQPGVDFQAQVCTRWEDSTIPFMRLGLRTVQLRFGIILSPNGGALKKMLLLTKMGLGSALGKGSQYFPWIHIYDAIKIIEKSIIENKIAGPYNLVSPTHLNYNEFSKTLATVLKRPYFMPNVPSFVLKLIFGEMSQIILEGSRVSANKILDSDFTFKFPILQKALDNLLMK